MPPIPDADARRYRAERDMLRTQLATVTAERDEATVDRLTLATENGVLRDLDEARRAHAAELIAERDALLAENRTLVEAVDAGLDRIGDLVAQRTTLRRELDAIRSATLEANRLAGVAS